MSDRVLEILGRPEIWAAVAAVVGFLTLTWLIRQAPLGQAARPESTDGPDPTERDRAVVLAVVGLLMIGIGGFVAVRYTIPGAIPLFAGGIGLVLWIMNRHRHQRHTSPTIRRLVAFGETALTASLLAGILFVGNVLAFRFGGRPIDLTHDQAYSLSSLTLNQVTSLDRPVLITVFFGDSPQSRRQLDRVRQLTDLYHTANPSKVEVRYLNPFADMQEFETLARRVPDVLAAGGDGLVVAYGGDVADAPRTVLGMRELFDLNASSGSGADRFVSSFRGEDAITSALMRLREGKRSRVGFTTGHGEPSTAEIDTRQSGYGLWKARLDSIGSDVLDVNLLSAEVPIGLDLLVIGGPKAPFQETEVDRIKQFLARGGSLLILVDHLEPSGLDDLLAIYNIRLGAGVAADSRFTFKNRPTIIYAPLGGSMVHPITGSLASQVVLVQNASPILVTGTGSAAQKGGGGRPPNPGIVTTPILRTSPDSWVESEPKTPAATFDRKTEQAGPVVIGVAVTTRPAIPSEQPVPRLVVFSTPSIGDNRLLWNEPTNIDLLMNSVSWLRGQPTGIGIAPKTHESLAFDVDPGLQLRLVMVPTLAALVMIIGLGLSTYLARRD